MQTLNQRQTCKKVKRIAVYNNPVKKCVATKYLFHIIPTLGMYFSTLNLNLHIYSKCSWGGPGIEPYWLFATKNKRSSQINP